MSNRIIKDFKGWSQLNETADITGIPANSPLFNKTPPLNLTPGVPGVNPLVANTPIGQGPHPDPLVNRVIDAGTAAQAAAAQAAAAQAAAAKAKAAPPVAATPIVPTPDLAKANAAALTRNDWAAIQAKLNAAETVLTLPTEPKTDTNTQYSSQFQNNANVNLLSASTGDTPPTYDPAAGRVGESRTRLYEEQLVPDGIAGPKTLLAVDTFVTNYNLNQANTTKLPADPTKDKATATTINPQVLAAIAAAIAAPTTQLPTGPTGPAAAANSVFGPSANITEADFATEPTKLLLATAKQFKNATAGAGTLEDPLILSIKACKSASDFYKLNAVISNTMSGDIAYIINDELEGDNIIEVHTIKDSLGLIGVTAAFLEEDNTNDDLTDTSGKVPSKLFKIKSFTITIPEGSDPATVFPPAVYAMAVKQLGNSTGSADILYA